MNDLAFAGAAAQARMLANGDLSAPELLEVYLERIARLDSQLRCYRVVLADRARREAAAAQSRLTRASGCRCSACRSRSRTTSTSPGR